jgi:hypothetical protein
MENKRKARTPRKPRGDIDGYGEQSNDVPESDVEDEKIEEQEVPVTKKKLAAWNEKVSQKRLLGDHNWEHNNAPVPGAYQKWPDSWNKQWVVKRIVRTTKVDVLVEDVYWGRIVMDE